MAQPYVGELRIFAGNFAPAGWMFCEGQLLPISEYETIFQLIGTTYGGDGQSTFALPDLRGRLPLHQGTGSSGTTYSMADAAGAEQVTLTINQIPNHTHPMLGASGNGSQANPNNNVLASSTLVKLYSGEAADMAMAANSITPIGGNQPHTNFQPYICLNYIISLFGIFPSQN